MIARPNNWNEVKTYSDRPKLPLDGYVCRIRQTVVQPVGTNGSEQLCVLFDIDEGEYAGFYADDFKDNTNADKKWKGVLRLWLPKDDGSDRDEVTKSILKGFITAVEQSNNGYSWNWDERSLKGKVVGIIMRDEEWEYKGKHGWTVRPFKATTVDAIRSRAFKLPDAKPLNGSTVPAPSAQSNSAHGEFYELEDEDSELPF